MSYMFPVNLPVKDIGELPPHITYEEYNKILGAVKPYFEKRYKNLTDSRLFQIDRDKLFIHYLWATGARVGDVCNIEKGKIDFTTKTLNLHVKKRKRWLKISLDDRILYETSEFLRSWADVCDKHEEIFGFTPQHAWQLINRYGAFVGMEKGYVHPHKFRHGLAIYLMSKGVPIPVISKRLGHSNVVMTMQMYLRVTDELERKMLKGVEMRGEG